MKKKDCLKVLALLLATSCGVGVAYGQTGFHGSGAMSQQSYTAPGGSYGFSSYDATTDGGYELGAYNEGGGYSMPGLFGGAEWLAWQVSGGSGNSMSIANIIDSQTQNESGKKDSTPDGNGVRAKIGYRTANMWDFAVGYTYFEAKDSGNENSFPNFGSQLQSTRSVSDTNPQSINYDDRIKLQMIDFEVGRKLEYGNFDFRPFGGFRWLELDSKQGGGYQYANAGGGNNPITDALLDDNSNVKGYGLRAGAEANVDICGGGILRAFGRGAGSVLVGDVKSKGSENDSAFGQILNRNSSETIALPGLEAAAGLAVKLDGLEIKGGYELNTIFNATSHYGRRDDLLFHGFFAGASLNY